MHDTELKERRKLFAIATATGAVARFVGELQAHMDTPAIRYEPTGQGVARAQKRLAEKRKANASIPATDAPLTRQQRRAAERAAAKRK